MKRPLRLASYLLGFVAAVAAGCSSKSPPEDFGDESRYELATYMGELQILTHKLGLAIDAKNRPLLAFYLQESLAHIGKIQADLPEYEGMPVALNIDRMMLPNYKLLQQSYDGPATASGDFKPLSVAYDNLLVSCNACHAIANRPYLQIVRNPQNPFLQAFAPFK